MSVPTQTCTRCGAVEIVRPDGRGFPPDIAKRRLAKRCKALGHVSAPIYRAGLSPDIERFLTERTSTMPETPDLTERARVEAVSRAKNVGTWNGDKFADGYVYGFERGATWAAQQSAAAERVSVRDMALRHGIQTGGTDLDIETGKRTAPEPVERVSVSAEAVFLIEGTHHFHGTKCLCGFDSHGRARSMTEHITGLTMDALGVTR